MSGLMVWLLAVVVLSIVLHWGFRREFRRLEREAAARRWAATSPALRRMAREFAEVQRQLGEALLPAAVRMGEALTKALNDPVRGLTDKPDDPAADPSAGPASARGES